MLKITNLNKYYNKSSHNKLQVLKDINIDLPDKGLISIVGESGSGKTTLLHAIGGLDRYEGEILYNGKSYHGEALDIYRQENIGVIFQNYLLFEELSVYENLALALRIIGIKDKEEVDKRIEYVLKQVGMFKQRKKPAKNLSGGQQQRVAIARALLKKTKILLADEPTGNLDRKNTIEIMNVLKAISKTTLVLLVTHNREMANIYSDEILVIKDGTISGENFEAVTALTNVTDDTIYLEDYSKEEVKSESFNISLYGEVANLEIKIIAKDKKLYLVSNQNITLIKPTNVKEKREVITTQELSQTDYDASWYDDSKRSHRTLATFKEILIEFFKQSRKRDKFLRFCFFALGCILAICCTLFFNSVFLDTSNSTALKGKYGIYPADLESYQSDFSDYEAIMPYVDKFANYNHLSLMVSPDYTNQTRIEYNYSNVLYLGDITEADLVAGSIGNCVITTALAQYFFNTTDYNSLIGKKILVSDNFGVPFFEIAGIKEDTGRAIYLDSIALNMLYISIWSDEIEAPFNTLAYEDYANQLVLIDTIDLGSSVDIYQVYVLEGSSYSLKQIINNNLQVVGFVKLEGTIEPFKTATQSERDQMLFFLNKADIASFKQKDYQVFRCLIANDIDYKIVEGRAPLNYQEVILPANSIYDDYSINDTYLGQKVVGFYLADYATAQDKPLVNEQTYVFMYYGKTTNIWFEPTDLAGLKAYLAEHYSDYQVLEVSEYNSKRARIDQELQILIYGSLAAVLFVIYVVFIFFVMRTKVINDSYDIALFRSLGATKKSFYSKFIKECLVMTLFTSTIGYIICFIFYQLFNSLTYDVLGLVKFFRVDLVSFLSGLAVIYLINILMSVLPAYLYLRKTPAELVAKYDM